MPTQRCWLIARSSVLTWRIGPLVRIGPNELLSTDPEVIRRISGVRSRYQKGRFYDSGKVTPGVDTVVSMRDEKKHKAMRAKMWAGVSLLAILPLGLKLIAAD